MSNERKKPEKDRRFEVWDYTVYLKNYKCLINILAQNTKYIELKKYIIFTFNNDTSLENDDTIINFHIHSLPPSYIIWIVYILAKNIPNKDHEIFDAMWKHQAKTSWRIFMMVKQELAILIAI